MWGAGGGWRRARPIVLRSSQALFLSSAWKRSCPVVMEGLRIVRHPHSQTGSPAETRLPHAPSYRALAKDFTQPCAASDGHGRANRENVLAGPPEHLQNERMRRPRMVVEFLNPPAVARHLLDREQQRRHEFVYYALGPDRAEQPVS